MTDDIPPTEVYLSTMSADDVAQALRTGLDLVFEAHSSSFVGDHWAWEAGPAVEPDEPEQLQIYVNDWGDRADMHEPGHPEALSVIHVDNTDRPDEWRKQLTAIDGITWLRGAAGGEPDDDAGATTTTTSRLYGSRSLSASQLCTRLTEHSGLRFDFVDEEVRPYYRGPHWRLDPRSAIGIGGDPGREHVHVRNNSHYPLEMLLEPAFPDVTALLKIEDSRRLDAWAATLAAVPGLHRLH